MSRNAPTTESSLLLQLPKSVLSFSDMSGDSVLMPVAVDNVTAADKSTEDDPQPEKLEGVSKVTESMSVCQLQQPLLMRRGSSPKMSVPYSESKAQSADVDSTQASTLSSGQNSRLPSAPSAMSYCPPSTPFAQGNWPPSAMSNYPPPGPFSQGNLPPSGGLSALNNCPSSAPVAYSNWPRSDPSASPVPYATDIWSTSAPYSNQGTENSNWSTSSVSYVGHPEELSQSFSNFQNQPQTMQPDSMNQPYSSAGYQNSFPPVPAGSPNSSFQHNTAPPISSAIPTFMEKSESHAVSYASNYMQSPVITPSTAPSYNSGRNRPQMPPPIYSNVPSQTYTIQSPSMSSEMYKQVYEPVKPYWLFRDIVETKEIWCGFSTVDSDRLETLFQQDPEAIVPVDGGRYDAILSERIKKPVYFEGKDLKIRRCTWFYRPDSSQRFIPFPEEASNFLEQHYFSCVTTGQWQKRINLPKIGSVAFESPELFLFYNIDVELFPALPMSASKITVESLQSHHPQVSDTGEQMFHSEQDSKEGPKPVKRGLPSNFDILANENKKIDNLVFIVQGIGSFCDLRFRTVTECVDGFRDIANKLLSSHFKIEVESGTIGRVEFLPVAWHAKLHTSDQGFDRCMQNITLPSIPKLRHFTNDTLLDILLYSSPSYCQTIIDTVASELNKLYDIFLKRNQEFSGKVFVAGHSLGSLILFDILANQKPGDVTNNSGSVPSSDLNFDNATKPIVESDKAISLDNIIDSYDSLSSLLESCRLEEYTEIFEKEKIDLSSVAYLSNDDLKDIGIPTGPRKKLLNAVHSSQNKNLPEADADVAGLTSNGSPKQKISTSEMSNETFVFPLKTSPCMQSIIYPRLLFEPAAFFALGSPISMFMTVRGYESISEDFRFSTCPNFYHIFHPYDPVAFRIECLIDPNFSAKPVLIPHHKGRKRMHLEIRENLSKVGSEIKQKVLETLRYTWNSLSGFARAHTFPSAAVEAEVEKMVSQQMSETVFEQHAPSETSETCEEIQIGSLNGGRRIDYVLQEKPIEALNDYIFALTSHSTYWDSEDTVLMILREIYATQGIMVSSQSVLENRLLTQYQHPSLEKAPTSTHSVILNTSTFQYADSGVLGNYSTIQSGPPTSTFYSQSMPSVMPTSSQSLHQLSNTIAPVSQVTNNVPVPSAGAIQQPFGPTMTSSAEQPVGPPPLTGFVRKSPFAR